MASASRRATVQAHQKVLDLSIATPQVVAHRLTRMALAGPVPNARDQKEFTGMVMEKQLAFAQSWWAAWNAALQGPWSMAWSTWQTALSGGMLASSPWAMWKLAERSSAPAAQVVNAALTPIARKASSNARRLARTPLVSTPRKRS
ncbi:MAG: hypothetical protein RR855_05610 [Comamonas sp.]